MLESFLQDLVRNVSEDETGFEGAGRFLSQEGFGTVFLSQDEAREFEVVVETLINRYGSRDLISRSYVEAELRRAIFTAFGEIDAVDRCSPARVTRAIDELDLRLSREPSSFHCFIQLEGAGRDGLPFRFGKLRFVVFNDSQLRKFREATRQHRFDAKELAKRRHVLRGIRDTHLWNGPCAIAVVKAKDAHAAEEIAVAEVRSALDVLNFFSDLTAYQSGRVFLPGDRGRGLTTAMILEDSSSWYSRQARAGPPTLFDFSKLRGEARYRSARRRLHRILAEEAVNPVDELLLSGVRWAGRAATELRDEHAFLWYAIALESVLLPEDARDALGYRLRMRAAHLLTDDLAERREVAKAVRDVYQTRSKIVHGGRCDLAHAELEPIRAITKAVLLRLLSHREVRRLESVAQYRNWFEDRMLR